MFFMPIGFLHELLNSRLDINQMGGKLNIKFFLYLHYIFNNN